MQYDKERIALSNSTSPGDDQMMSDYQSRHADLLRWQQETSDELVLFVHELKNEVYDFDRGWVRRDGDMPLLNDKGIQMIQRQLRPFFNRNSMNTKLDEDTIRRTLVLPVTQGIVHDLAVNYHQYGLTKESVPTIGTQIRKAVVSLTIPSAYRSIGGWNKERDTVMFKRTEVSTAEPEQRKKLFGLI